MKMAFSIIGVPVLADGFKIEVIREGNGDIAESGQRVAVHYEGRLTDDTVFDASRRRGQPFTFTVGAGQVIQGWEQGVAGMRVGEMRRLTIPSELGYGASGVGDVIPPHASLLFDIELMAVNAAVTLGNATPAELLKAQKAGVIIVDIRRPEEWMQTGIIEGAETITAFDADGSLNSDFQQQFMKKVPTPDTPVVIYCLMGARTANLGAALVEQLGFLEVRHLSEGMLGWTADGYETVTYKPLIA